MIKRSIRNPVGTTAFVLLSLILTFCGERAFARSVDEVRVEVDLHVPPIQKLEMNSGLIHIPAPTAQDFQTEYIDLPEPVILDVCSNVPWELSVRLADPAGGSDTENVPPVTMYWRVGKNRYKPLLYEWRTIASGAQFAAREQVILDLRVRLRWTQTLPGIYEPNIEYRLSPAGG